MSIFDILGGRGKEPRTQQVVQSSKLQEEVAPFAKEILEAAKTLYTKQMEEGYKAYPGQTIAPLTVEQLESQEGLKALVGTQRPLQEEALAQYRTGLTERFTPEVAQEYMSPYQRAVTDIEKREAQRSFESQIMPAFEKQAVAAGGMSGLGTRAGVQASELGRAQMQRLGDIETRGLQSAYKDAQNLFQQQQQRERTAAGDIAGMAPQLVASGITEQGLLKTVGEGKQAIGQEALNEAYFRHLEEQAYPEERLADYSGFVYGNPLMQQRTMTSTQPMPGGASRGQQLLGLGLTAAKMYGMGGGAAFGGSGFTMGNLGGALFGSGKKTGGRLSGKTGGGLSSLPVVYRQNSGPVRPPRPRPTLSERGQPPLPVAAPAPVPASAPTFSAADVANFLKQAEAEREKEIGTESIRGLIGRERDELEKQAPGISFEDLYSGVMEGDPDDPVWRVAMGALQKGFQGQKKLTKEQQKKLEALNKRETDAELKREQAVAAARAKAAGLGGKSFTPAWKEVKDSIAAKYGFVLDEHGTIKLGKNQFLDTDSKGYIDYQADLDLANTEFLKIFQQVGNTKYQTQVWAVQKALERVEQARAKRKDVNEPQIHPKYPNARKASDDQWYIPHPTPDNPKGWALVPSPK
jgi:hypothetical protein